MEGFAPRKLSKIKKVDSMEEMVKKARENLEKLNSGFKK